MDAKHKAVLKDNRVMLMRNIVWNPELLHYLKQYNILTQAMIEDIQKCSSQAEKNKTLLDLLPIRGAKTFDRFCDTLMLSGNFLMADALRDDEKSLGSNNSNHRGVELQELFKIIPFLEKSFSEEQKRSVEGFLLGKIKEKVTKNLWRSDVGKEKDKALEWRQKHLDQQWHYEDKLRHKEKTIEELHQKVKKLKAQVEHQMMEIKQMMRGADEEKVKHNKQLQHQIRANDAESRTIHRLQNTISDDNSVLNTICSRLKERMDSKYRMNDSHDELFYLQDNFQKFLNHVDDLESVNAQLTREKEYTMGMCGLSNKPITFDLREHLRDLIVRREEKMQELDNEVVILKGRLSRQSSLNGRDASPTGYQLQIAELNVQIAKKDEVIRSLTKGMNGDFTNNVNRDNLLRTPDLLAPVPRSPRIRRIENAAPIRSHSPTKSNDSNHKTPVHSKYLQPINRSKKSQLIAPVENKEDIPTKATVVTVGFLQDAPDTRDMRKYHHI